MDEETQGRVEAAVLEILQGADMEEATEYKIRSMAAERLGIDLSLPDRKRFVRKVVESFLVAQNNAQQEGGCVGEEEKQEEEQEQEQEQEQELAEEREDERKGSGGDGRQEKKQEYNDDGEPIICHLSNKRRVTIQDFRGKTLVSIREFYERDGRQLPSSKGISLTADQWNTFANAVPDIEAAIEKLK